MLLLQDGNVKVSKDQGGFGERNWAGVVELYLLSGRVVVLFTCL